MKYFNIDETIDRKLFERFIEFVNANQDDEWTIIIDTGGGCGRTTSNILRIINDRRKRVTVVSSTTYSAGFELFYLAKCKRIITKDTIGMYHIAGIDMRIDVKSRKPMFLEDRCLLKSHKKAIRAIKMAKKFMNKKELKKFLSGGDVYFTFKRMRQIFPDAQT